MKIEVIDIQSQQVLKVSSISFHAGVQPFCHWSMASSMTDSAPQTMLQSVGASDHQHHVSASVREGT